MNRPQPKRDNRTRSRYSKSAKPKPQYRPSTGTPFRIVEKVIEPTPEVSQEPGAFRIVIAVHRPRFRSRAERGAARADWEVTALLNKQDPVGLCMKAPRPPDVLVLSGDFGRQKNYAIFRAVQAMRAKGMRIIGVVEDCETAPEGFPDSAPAQLCDVCITPPLKANDFRELFAKIYTEIRGEEPPPLLAQLNREQQEEEDDED